MGASCPNESSTQILLSRGRTASCFRRKNRSDRDVQEAIARAKENEYINEEALAHELAAKFYFSWGKQKIAQTYMTNAYYAYIRWGALAKVKHLEEKYPQLLR